MVFLLFVQIKTIKLVRLHLQIWQNSSTDATLWGLPPAFRQYVFLLGFSIHDYHKKHLCKSKQLLAWVNSDQTSYFRLVLTGSFHIDKLTDQSSEKREDLKSLRDHCRLSFSLLAPIPQLLTARHLTHGKPVCILHVKDTTKTTDLWNGPELLSACPTYFS